MDTFLIDPTWGEGAASIWWVETREMLLKCLQCLGWPHDSELTSQIFNSARLEKPLFKHVVIF